MWRWKEKVEYTPNDVKTIVERSLATLEQFAGDELHLLVSGHGVITGQQCQKEVDELLAGEGRTTVGLIGSKLEVGRNVVLDCLAKSSVAHYRNGENVLKAGEIERLKAKLQNKIDRDAFVSQLDACNELTVDVATLNWIAQQLNMYHSQSQQILLSSKHYQSIKTQAVDTFVKTERPLLLSAVVPEKVPKAIQYLLAKDEDVTKNKSLNAGQFDTKPGGDLLFTPRAYIDNELGRVVAETKSQCVVPANDQSTRILTEGAIQENGIIKHDGYFIHKDSALGRVAEIKQQVDSSGYYALEDADRVIIAALSPEIKAKEITHKGVLTHYASKSLLDKVEKECRDSLMTKVGDHASQLLTDQRGKIFEILTNTPALKRLSEHSGIKERDVLAFKPAQQLPAGVVELALKRRAKQTVNDYNAALLSQIKEQGDKAYQAALDKTAVYVNGLEFVQDEKLRDKLLAEVVKYTHDHALINSAKPDTLEDLYKTLPDLPQDTAQTKENMVSELQQQVNATKDAALVLHLAALIAHSRLPGNRGLLRATGKHVPKIIKQLTAGDGNGNGNEYAHFVELKDLVVKGGDAGRRQELVELVAQTVEE